MFSYKSFNSIIMHHILRFFDKFEDKVRAFLSHYPMFYAIIGGISVVLFWRSVWDVADDINLSPFWSLVGSVIVMMATGLFVSFFIGDRIILSGVKHEKKVTEKTEEEIEEEETILINIVKRLEKMEKDINQIKDEVSKK